MVKVSDELKRAVICLDSGSVIVHATEGIFGIAARALDLNACKLVWEIKNRPFEKKFIVIFSSIDKVLEYATIDNRNKERIQNTWPGHTTWVLDSRINCPNWLKDSYGRVAVRVPAHSQMQFLLKKCGPLITTSANVSGFPPAKTYKKAVKDFARNSLVSFILPGETDEKIGPSAIYDGLTCKMLRR